MFCQVNYTICATENAVLSCGNDDENGGAIMISRSLYEYSDTEEAQCVLQEPEIAIACNDQVEDHMCHSASQTDDPNELYEITEMTCVADEEAQSAECVHEATVLVADCNETGQICAGKNETEAVNPNVAKNTALPAVSKT
jgi:hypothetical protein